MTDTRTKLLAAGVVLAGILIPAAVAVAFGLGSTVSALVGIVSGAISMEIALGMWR